MKAAVLGAELTRQGIPQIVVHTGSRYADSPSDLEPDYNLEVAGGDHGRQTAEMLALLEPILRKLRPDFAVVYDGTNSALAGALTAAKLGIPIAHVEAGLRSLDRSIPEEINRIVTDHLCSVLLVPDERALLQLKREGIESGAFIVGDLLVDFAVNVAAGLPPRPPILDRFELVSGAYAVATIQAPANTADRNALAGIIAGLRGLPLPVILPTDIFGAGARDNIIRCNPVSPVEMIGLLSHARVVLTDSGFEQKQARALGVPCVTLRSETECIETLEDGWNVLVATNPRDIIAQALRPLPSAPAERQCDNLCAPLIVKALHSRSEIAYAV
ncbi:MAG: UDP-N-acetylglucosamine 2-epimerase [Candidatus Baltobacteraceae bacterium]